MTNYQEEPATGNSYDLKLIKRLSLYFYKYRKEFSLSILLLIFSSFLMLAGPYLIKIAIDEHIAKGDTKGLSKIVSIYGVIIFISFFVNGIRVYLMNLTGQKVMYDLRVDLFTHLQKMSLSFYDRMPTGKLVTRVVNDVEVLNEMFTSGIIIIFGDFFFMGGIAFIMYYLNKSMAISVFIAVPLIITVTTFYRKKVRKSYREIRKYVAMINSFLSESISGINTIQLFCKEKKNFKSFKKINLNNLNQQLKNILYNAVFYPTIEIIKAISLGIVIWYGGRMVIKESIQIGVLVAFIQYTYKFYFPIRDLAEKFDIFQSAMASTERIFHLLDTKEEIKTKSPSVKLNKIEGKIEFKDVWFSYTPKKGLDKHNDIKNYALKGISFDLKPGESLGIIGATGSGKSSIINILSKFYDIQQGSILLDGHNIQHIDKHELRAYLGVIHQDVFIFSGSSYQNIGLGDKRISKTKIKKAAEYIYADNFIKNLPNGYDHDFQERGKDLSSGQRQLLAFARALVFDPKVLILDEAMSNIDPKTENLIANGLKKLIAGRTSIIIAHRLSSIKNVDKVLVLKNGRVIEFGTQDALIKKKGIFYNLIRIRS